MVSHESRSPIKRRISSPRLKHLSSVICSWANVADKEKNLESEIETRCNAIATGAWYLTDKEKNLESEIETD